MQVWDRHTRTHGLARWRVMRRGSNRSGLPDGELERPSRNRWDGNGGMLGTRGAEGGKVGREHRQFGTTIIAAHTASHLPPLICRHHIPFAAHWCCNESVIWTHMYGSWHGSAFGNSWWKHLQAIGQKEPSICTLTSHLPSGIRASFFSIKDFREDERNWNREEMKIDPFQAHCRGH